MSRSLLRGGPTGVGARVQDRPQAGESRQGPVHSAEFVLVHVDLGGSQGGALQEVRTTGAAGGRGCVSSPGLCGSSALRRGKAEP